MTRGVRLRQDADEPGAHAGPRRQARVRNVWFAVAILVPALISATWIIVAARAVEHSTTELKFGEVALSDTRLYDEVLTMSANMAAQTGDRAWIDRYNRANDALNKSLATAQSLARDTQVAVVLHTMTANDALVAMEMQSFAAVERGDLEGARAILASAEYAKQKAAYAKAITQGRAAYNADIAALTAQLRWLLFSQLALTLLTLVIIVLLARAASTRVHRERQFLQQSMDSAIIGMAMLALDRTITYANPALCELLGYPRSSLIGVAFAQVVHRDDAEAIRRDWDHLAAGTGDPSSRRRRFMTADGGTVWVDIAVAAVRDRSGRVRQYVVQAVDVSAETRARQNLEASEKQFRIAMESAPSGVALAGPDGIFIEANPALCQLLGTTREAIVGHTLDNWLLPEDRDCLLAETARLRSGDDDRLEHEHRLHGTSGEPWVKHSVNLVRNAADEPYLFIHQFVDESTTHDLQTELAYRASHDTLTGLANRGAVMNALQHLTSSRRTPGRNIGVLFCDVDRLKAINDAHGHRTGDVVLAEAATRMVSAVRASDIVARVGGDEFVIVLPDIEDRDDVAAAAAKILEAASGPVSIGAVSVTITLSIGGALAGPDDNPDTVLRRADQAMYSAKEQGRDRVCIAD